VQILVLNFSPFAFICPITASGEYFSFIIFDSIYLTNSWSFPIFNRDLYSSRSLHISFGLHLHNTLFCMLNHYFVNILSTGYFSFYCPSVPAQPLCYFRYCILFFRYNSMAYLSLSFRCLFFLVSVLLFIYNSWYSFANVFLWLLNIYNGLP